MMKSLKIGNLLARIPIVQGGMGVGISLSGLASAVANEDASLLCCECNEDFITHGSIAFNG